jgi:biopolymer transport protein ExbD
VNIRRKRKPASTIVPIASMGDIAFLLIIFFVLTTTFAKEAKVKLEMATSPDITKLKDSQISVTQDAEGVIRVQGEECEMKDLKQKVQALVAGKDKKVVMLKIDKDLKHSAFKQIFLDLSEVGADIALVGQKEKK